MDRKLLNFCREFQRRWMLHFAAQFARYSDQISGSSLGCYCPHLIQSLNRNLASLGPDSSQPASSSASASIGSRICLLRCRRVSLDSSLSPKYWVSARNYYLNFYSVSQKGYHDSHQCTLIGQMRYWASPTSRSNIARKSLTRESAELARC